MLVSSRGTWMAALWASTALATPLIAEPILSRDLVVRQSATAKCPDSYTSRNGLGFTTYCEQNNPFNDAQNPFNSPSMQDCMEHCSRYWGNGEGCFGIVWIQSNGECWIRNSNVTTASLVPLGGYYSALIQQGGMNKFDNSCPNADLSINKLDGVDGIQYTTHCGKVIGGFDGCWAGYGPCWDIPYKGFYHAESLQACLKICVNEHPLCQAVSFNPTMEIGYANCWLKTGFPQTMADPSKNMGTLHSAAITQIDPVDRNCPSSKQYSAKNSRKFDLHCGQLNAGTNITSMHTQNVTACMDACSTSDKGCIGIVFDSTLQGGYQNCYLQNTTSVITDQTSATYAVLAGSSLPSSSASGGASSKNSSSSGGGSKAWIAGPVIGGLVALGLIGAAIFWWRRRKAAHVAGAEKPHDGYAVAPAYAPAYSSPNQHHPQPYYDAPAGEIDSRTRTELPAVAKYAHKGAPPSELPS